MPPSCALLGGFAIGALVALLWQHQKCVAEPGGNPPGPPHALRMPAKAPLASVNINVPAACCLRDIICNEAVPFRPYCGGVATRTRNVSEYILVLALCLVGIGQQCRIYTWGPCSIHMWGRDPDSYFLSVSLFVFNDAVL